ncbi:MAG TPA: hypothetical protein GXX35_01945 [Thermoanaerobacterales bacterium]|nr:hypothetical protein [Thermoanaerobacterales bacterium]
MAKETSGLPAYTTIENMLSLLDIFRNKNGDEKTSKPLFGKTSSYGVTKSALRAFKLIQEDSCILTPLGRKISFSNDDEKKDEVLKLIVNYSPYESLLMNIFRENETETEITEIVNFWGKFEKGSTPRNLKDAARLFGTMIEYIGFGKYIKGSGGKATRIVWAPDAKQKFEAVINLSGKSIVEPENLNAEVVEIKEESPEIHVENVRKDEKQTKDIINNETTIDIVPDTTIRNYTPNINISVDMSSWSDEKIKNFFKYVYGIFEEDNQ